MFLLEGLGYWPSTAIAYVAGAVMSFFLNRHFTFHSEETLGRSAVKFAVNVAVCYVVGYGLARLIVGGPPPDCRPGGVVGAVLQAGGHGALHRPQLLRTAVFAFRKKNS
ncbi:GtrA family protein [Flavonifractor plautii]|nr:GtrA family protein [Flavonifractor plautii]